MAAKVVIFWRLAFRTIIFYHVGVSIYLDFKLFFYLCRKEGEGITATHGSFFLLIQNIIYQLNSQMSDINCFFFTSPLLEDISITVAIQRSSAVDKKKTIQFIYQSFRNLIGIIYLYEFVNNKINVYLPPYLWKDLICLQPRKKMLKQ